MEIFQAFGLDIKLLIANLINFLILVGVLYKFAYGPILKFIKERQDKIDQGLKDSAKAKKSLEDAEEKQKKMLTQTHKKSQEILEKAKEQAKVQSEAILIKTKDEAKSVIENAKKTIRLEQEAAIAKAKQEIASLVISTTEKVLIENIDEKKNKDFIEKTIKDIK